MDTEHTAKLVQNCWDLLKAIFAAVAILFIFLIVLEVQIQWRNSDIDTVRTNVKETQTTLVETKKILEGAIQQGQNGSVKSQDIEDALKAIHRMEIFICGGPCPNG